MLMLDYYQVIFKWHDTSILATVREPMGKLDPIAKRLYFINNALKKIEDEWGFDIRNKVNFNDVIVSKNG